MALKNLKRGGGGGDNSVLPEDNYPAVLVAVVDLGIQRSIYNGEEKWLPQVYLAWELTGEEKPGRDQGNYILGRHYTASLNPKATLVAIINGMGVKIPEDGDFDFHSLLGRPCCVQVTHDAKGERTYMRIGGISKPPKGVVVKPSTLDPVYYEIPADPEVESIFDCPDWMPWHFGKNLTEVVSEGILNAREDRPRQARPVTSGAQPVRGGGHKIDPDEDVF